MFTGIENAHKNKRYLHVENDGFISMYALFLLSIFLAFALMFAQSIHTFVYTHTSKPTQYIDIHIIKEIQQELKKQAAEDEQIKTQDDPKENNIKKSDHESTIQKTVTSVYQNCTIQYVYEASQVHVSYLLQGVRHTILVTYHQDHKSIMNYVYE